jgi:signal transduction histidine kinase
MRAALHRIARRRFAGFPLPDVLLAAVFCLIAVASVLAGAPAEGTIAVTLPVSIVSTLALAWRRRTPVVAAALFAGAGLVQTFVAVSPGSLWALAVGLIVIYSVASEYSEGLAAVVGAGLVAVLLLEERIDNGVDYLFIVVLFGGVWLLGRAARSWRIRLSTAERRQQDAARLAVAEERVRLARELHDVVAHSLGVIAVQADAADAALHTDPLRAVAPVQAIRDSARAALTEVRSLLGMLRSDDGEHPGTESPGISAITSLVEPVRAAGVPVHLEMQLGDDSIPASVDLAAYRIAQECLTNVLKHGARGDAEVAVVQTRDELTIRVSNEAAGTHAATDAPGYGLVGIRERVAPLGGSVTTTRDGTRFSVFARIPLTPPRRRRR